MKNIMCFATSLVLAAPVWSHHSDHAAADRDLGPAIVSAWMNSLTATASASRWIRRGLVSTAIGFMSISAAPNRMARLRLSVVLRISGMAPGWVKRP